MDLIGEFHPASSKGNRYALTAICMLTGFTFCIPLKSKCAEDIINAYINHICCPFGPSKKILTDNGTEFKNKLWTEVFEKLRTEQKFTHIYSPQCNGRIRIPQVPESYNSKATGKPCRMGQTSMESNSCIQLLPHRVFRYCTVLPNVWMGSSRETHTLSIRESKIFRNR